MVSVQPCPTAGYALNVAVRIIAEAERGRTNGGKVKADACANIKARYEGDSAASADGIIRHSIRMSQSPLSLAGVHSYVQMGSEASRAGGAATVM